MTRAQIVGLAQEGIAVTGRDEVVEDRAGTIHPRRVAAEVTEASRRHDGLIVTSPDDPVISEALRAGAARHPSRRWRPTSWIAVATPNVGPDDSRAGRVAGDLMGRFLGPAGLASLAGHRHHEAGSRAVLGEHHPTCRLALALENREDAQRAGRLVLAALHEAPQLRGLYDTSTGAYAGVSVRRHAGRSDLVFITHELTEDRRALLKNCAIHAVVDQNPPAEAMAAIETMARLLGRLDGEPTSRVTPIQIFTGENV